MATILLIDDDDLFRNMVAQILAREGYEVRCAAMLRNRSSSSISRIVAMASSREDSGSYS